MNDNFFGILPVYKEKGWTSFDVIGKLRGVLKIKRLGHAGTLDPMATGVLPVFVGKATKACDILPDDRKVYRAGFKLGVSTDTEDITGEILETSDKGVSLLQVQEQADKLVGDIMQIPPMYSAVKINGKKLYELAREGKTVERKARPIRVNSIEITRYDEDAREGELIIDCQKGTYVRTVISDMGKALGTFGVMTSLERTYSGGVDIKSCLTVAEIEKIVSEGRLEEVVEPLDKVFEMYESLRLSERITPLYKNGVKLRPPQVGKSQADSKVYRVYGFEGEFIGLGHFVNGEFRSKKNF